MSNLADLLNKIGIVAGIKEDNEEFKALVQNKALATTNVLDDLGKLFDDALDGELLSVEAAKNNEDLKNHFFATFANGIDSEIDNAIKALGIDDETVTLLKNTDSSFKKISLLPTRLKSKYEALIEEAKKGENTPEDIEKLNTEIGKLNDELSGLKDTTVDKEFHENTISSHASALKNMNVKNLLAARKLTTTLPRNVAIEAAISVFNAELKAKGITLNDDLQLKSSDGSLDYFDKNNKKVEIGDFVDSLLAENKLLEVSPPAGGGNPPPAPLPGDPPPPTVPNAFTEHADEVEEHFASKP